MDAVLCPQAAGRAAESLPGLACTIREGLCAFWYGRCEPLSSHCIEQSCDPSQFPLPEGQSPPDSDLPFKVSISKGYTLSPKTSWWPWGAYFSGISVRTVQGSSRGEEGCEIKEAATLTHGHELLQAEAEEGACRPGRKSPLWVWPWVQG